MDKARPTSKQWAMTSTEIATRIAVICLETMKSNTDRDALLFELHQLEVIQGSRRKQILEASCY